MKFSKATVLAIAALFIAAGAGFAKGGSQGDTVTIKLADVWAETHPMTKALDDVFIKQVEEKTGGKIKIDAYHNGQLGSEADLWNSVRDGSNEIVVVGSVMNTEWAPMLISDWPFLYRDIDHAKKVWTGSVAEEVNQKFHEKFPTTYVLGWGPNSARTFTSNRKLTSVADFVGQKFRMPSNPIHVGIAQNLGSSSQVIPLGDLYTSLQTGVVDGQDNGMVTVISQGFFEVQKYLYETNHIVATMEIIVNAKFYDSLTPEYKKIINDAAKAASIKAWDDYAKSLDADRNFLKGKGMTITACSPADQAQIITKIKPLTDKLLSDNKDWAPDLIGKVNAVK
ncbi:ABC transporter substrate-binding protein [Spirochaetia bacterium]|nr:ABC transporter substrate-binding protein [Spirochaetia bacterium]